MIQMSDVGIGIVGKVYIICFLRQVHVLSYKFILLRRESKLR